MTTQQFGFIRSICLALLACAGSQSGLPAQLVSQEPDFSGENQVLPAQQAIKESAPSNRDEQRPQTTNEFVGRRHALIVIGLPGGPDRRKQMLGTATALRDWLQRFLGADPDDVTILSGSSTTENTQPATQERIREVVAMLSDTLTPRDGLWVFLIGHGSLDAQFGYFHLPGPDLNARQWGGLFEDVKAREQVFWLTHSASGRFLQPLSAPNRIVIAATVDGEVNETRFPESLIAVLQERFMRPNVVDNVERQGEKNAETDPPNLLDLFRWTHEHIQDSFEQDNLLATEHAQLDDNGDGTGSESSDLGTTDELLASGAQAEVVDGAIAARLLFFDSQPPSKAESETESKAETESETEPKAEPKSDAQDSETSDRSETAPDKPLDPSEPSNSNATLE